MLLPVRKKYPGGLRASLAAKKMKKEHQNFWWYSLPLCRRAGMFPDNRPQRAGRISPAPGFPRMRFFFLWLSVMLSPSTGHISCPDPAWRNACPVSGEWCCQLLCSLIPQNPGACSRIQAGTGPVRGVPELCAGVMQRAYGRGAPSPAAEGSADGASSLYWGGNRTVTRSPSPLPA